MKRPFLFALTVLAGLACLVLLPRSAANDPLREAKVLPPGNPVAGQSVFIERGCYQCHSAGETRLPETDLEPRLTIALGTPAQQHWTRDDYAQAIMNPAHTVAEEYRVIMLRLGDKLKAENTPMPGFNEVLTVAQLIDLATFLAELNP